MAYAVFNTVYVYTKGRKINWEQKQTSQVVAAEKLKQISKKRAKHTFEWTIGACNPLIGAKYIE